MSESRLHDVYVDLKGLELPALESFGTDLATWQRGCNFWIGDLARYAERHYPNSWQQVFPEWISPGLVARCKAVAEAYPREEDRNPDATWTVHMREANRPDRIARVQAHVDAGRTSDEARDANRETAGNDRPRWLLAVDVNYYVHRFWYSGAGVESAVGVATWIQRTAERLREKGLTDVACCFDSPTNHRKTMTEGWEDKYKDRPPKPTELSQQLHLVRQLLDGRGFACVRVEGYEADDCMASLAKQFAGRVTLLTQDKDCRQCLSDKCNMLLDVEWVEDSTSGDHLPDYKWLSAKQHTEATGLRPEQWPEFQCISGDNVDGIKGAVGIGEKGAADLVQTFGTVEAAIEAAKADDIRIKPSKRKSLIEFEGKVEVTRKLVTLVDDLDIPTNTRV